MRSFTCTCFILYVVTIGFYGCEERNDLLTSVHEDHITEDKLTGAWRLFERGYSQGVGYIIEPVSPQPAEILIFDEERVSSSIPEFSNTPFYRVMMDTITQTQFLALYKKKPDQESEWGPTYSVQMKGDTLKLSFRYCYEGCHLALKRIN
jgi:hypothetical protein